jgi:protein-disulfide isomerase
MSVATRGFNFNPSLNSVINELNSLNSRTASLDVKQALTDAVNSLQQAETAMQQAQGNSNTPSGTNAQVTIEEFSDFQCPFCGSAYSTVKQLQNEYGSKINLVFKQFPLASLHPYAEKAAEASECARDQGKFWQYYDILFTNQNALTVDDFKKYASQLGLDSGKFNTCLDTGAKTSVVQKDLQEGQSRGVTGTPTFFINGEKLVGAQPIDSFKSIIDRLLAGGSPQVTPTPSPTQTAQAQNAQATGSIDDDPIEGSTSAKVVLLEWSDFQCPYCGRFFEQTLPSIRKDYIDTGKVKMVFRQFPLSFHPNAEPAAEASECANEQGKFWEYHDKLFSNQDALSVENYKAWAKDLGLDTTEFNSCLDSNKYQNEITADMSDGQSSGITGTPGFIVGILQDDGKTVVGVAVKGAQPIDFLLVF